MMKLLSDDELVLATTTFLPFILSVAGRVVCHVGAVDALTHCLTVRRSNPSSSELATDGARLHVVVLPLNKRTTAHSASGFLGLS